MEWSEATIENDGFSMVLGQPTIGNDGFSMVGHHWSNDGMVTYHRQSLVSMVMMDMLMIIEVMTIYFTNSKLRRLDVQYAIFWLGIIAADWVAVRQLFYLPALPCKSASMSSC